MNRRLLDPFQSVQLPEVIEEYLDHGVALCMAFNRRGTLLASGTKEGQVVLWDFETRGVAAVLLGHEGPVNSVSWSRNGHFLLSGSDDRHVILWNVEKATQVAQVILGSAVIRVSLSPRPPNLGVVSLADGPPLVVELESGKVEPLPAAGDGGDAAPARGGGGSGPGGSGLLALFSRRGDTIIGCQTRGALTVVDTASRRILDVVRLPTTTRVADLSLNRKGTLLLATCQDHRVRMYDVIPPESVPTPAAAPPSEAQLAEALANKAVKSGSLLYGDAGLLRPVREFQNRVERTPWRTATFSCDSEHVVGVSAAKAQQHIYIWNRPLGNMERILEGPKESGLELAWHPISSLLLSCGASGRIYLWAKVQAENWSAFAPDFKELDENCEYVEREDEFDWNTPGARGDFVCTGHGDGDAAATPQPGGSGDAPEVLDITTREPYYAFSSDDEAGTAEELLYLPVVIDQELTPPPPAAPKPLVPDPRWARLSENGQRYHGGDGGSGLEEGPDSANYASPQGPGQAARRHFRASTMTTSRRLSQSPRGDGAVIRRRSIADKARRKVAAAAADSEDGGTGSGAGGEGTDMEEEGLGMQGPGQEDSEPSEHVAREDAAATLYPRQHEQQQQQQQHKQHQQHDQLVLQQQLFLQQLMLQQNPQQLLLQQPLLLDNSQALLLQLLQHQQAQHQQQQGQPQLHQAGQPPAWMAGAALPGQMVAPPQGQLAGAALPGQMVGLNQGQMVAPPQGPLAVSGAWAGVDAGTGVDAEMREAAGEA